MKDLNNVIRIVLDEDKNVILMGIYINNKRYLLGEYFDMNILSEKLNNFNWETDVIYLEKEELTFFNDNKDEYFPLIEDFLHLLDYTDIKIDDVIYMFDEQKKVTHIENGKRLKGTYDYYHWELIDDNWYSAKVDIEYNEDHEITLFKVENDDNLYVWDDYTYQQSYLHLKFIQYNT